MFFNSNFAIVPFVFEINQKILTLYDRFNRLRQSNTGDANEALYDLFCEMFKDLEMKVPSFEQFSNIMYIE